MLDRLIRDLRLSPHAFQTLGPADPIRIAEWCARSSVPVLDELRELWVLTGGGDLFETEEVYCPFADVAYTEYDIDVVNEWFRSDGLAPNHLVFHRGVHLTALSADGDVFVLDERLRPRRRLGSVSAWYDDLRGEFAPRYGLET